MEPSRIQAIDHVELEAPHAAEAALRWFYGELAGLEEVGPAMDGQSLRFRSARIEIRIRLVLHPKIESASVRVTIAVRSLFDTSAALDDAGLTYERVSGLMFTDRTLQVFDPAGNRIAFRQVWDFGVV